MRRTLVLALALTGAFTIVGCGSTETNTNRANSNVGNPPREGVVETNVNMPANTNSKSVSSNTAVVTNNNGNKNTSGIRSTNANHNANKRKP